jgi:hypothetical protein
MEVQDNNERITQGQKKIVQYIEDLKRNKHFLAVIARLEKEKYAVDKKKDEAYESFINEFIEKYQELEHLLTIKRKKVIPKSQKIFLFIAERYGLSMALINDLIFKIFRKKDDSSYSIWNDMCVVTDNCDFSPSMYHFQPVSFTNYVPLGKDFFQVHCTT